MKKREGRLSTKIIMSFMIAMVFIVAATTFILFQNTKVTVEKTIANFSIHTAKTVATGLDTSSFEAFLQNKTETEDYWRIREQLGDYQQKSGAAYVYIMQEKDNKVYILVDSSAKEAEDAAEIGAPTTGTSFEDISPVLKGEYNATDIINDPIYGKYLSAFAPIKNEKNEIIGILGVDISADNVNDIQENVIIHSLPLYLSILLVLMGVTAVILFFFTRARLAPLEVISKTAMEIQDGHLGRAEQLMSTLQIKGNDEIRHVANSFKEMTERIKTLIAHIADVSSHLMQTSEQLTSEVESAKGANERNSHRMSSIASGSQSNLHQLEESVRAMEEMSVGIQKIADSSTGVSESSNEVTSTIQSGNENISTLIKEIKAVETSIMDTATHLNTMVKEADEISKITKLITEISEQTNLLALNAAIEASRAGEHGRGFSVVAEEVRILAEKSKASAKEISKHIHTFTQVTESIMTEMDDSMQKAQRGTEAVTQAGEVFSQILQSVQTVNEEIFEVSAVTEELSAGSEEMFASLENFAHMTKQAVEDTVDAEHASKEQLENMNKMEDTTIILRDLAQKLEQAVAVFK